MVKTDEILMFFFGFTHFVGVVREEEEVFVLYGKDDKEIVFFFKNI